MKINNAVMQSAFITENPNGTFLFCKSFLHAYRNIRLVWSIVLRAKVFTGFLRTVKFEPCGFYEKSPHLRKLRVVLLRKKLDCPKPCTDTALETINDRRDG